MAPDATKPPRGRQPRPKKPAFQFYPADWLADANVQAMTLEEKGAYIDLLCYCWREGSIPTDPVEIARLLHVEAMLGVAIWERLSRCFDSSGRHPRLEDERRKQDAWSKSLSKAGKAGAARRWPGHSQAIARPMPGLWPEDASSSSSSSSSQNPSPPPKIAPSEHALPPDAPDPRVPAERQPRPRRTGLTRLFDAAPEPEPRTHDTRQFELAATQLIDRIRALETAAGNGDAFNPGVWWGKTKKAGGRVQPMVDALAQLGKRLEVGDRPESPWAYLDTTYAEKAANFHAEQAADENERRKHEPTIFDAR